MKGLGDFSRKVKGNVLQLDQIVRVVSWNGTLCTHWLVISLAEGVDFQGRMVLAEEDACSRSRTFEIIVHLHHHMLGLCVTLGTLVSKEHLTGSTMKAGSSSQKSHLTSFGLTLAAVSFCFATPSTYESAGRAATPPAGISKAVEH